MDHRVLITELAVLFSELFLSLTQKCTTGASVDAIWRFSSTKYISVRTWDSYMGLVIVWWFYYKFVGKPCCVLSVTADSLITALFYGQFNFIICTADGANGLLTTAYIRFY